MAVARPVPPAAELRPPIELVLATPDLPLVTIVTPSLDPGDRLARCLESVAGQTYPRTEHIVVDGGSSDGTPARLAAAGVQWHSRPGSGQAAAINAGFALGSGSILTWLNADDVLLPDATERAVEAFEGSPELGLVYGSCRIVEEARTLLTWSPPRRFDVDALESGSWIAQPGTFFRRGVFEEAGGLDESFELAMDVDLWLRLLAAGVRSRRLRELLAVFELHEGSKTSSTPRARFHEENARAFALAGRTGGAAISLGRAAAAVAAERRGAELDRHICAAQARGRVMQPPLPARTIAAAARAEAAVIELHTSLRGVRHLGSLEVWRDRRIRRRLAAALRRGGPAVARRLAGRGPL